MQGLFGTVVSLLLLPSEVVDGPSFLNLNSGTRELCDHPPFGEAKQGGDVPLTLTI